ncbi:MAG: low affinity iron permease family protein [Steroidobacteraceae bacterium]
MKERVRASGGKRRSVFDHFAGRMTQLAGSSWAFGIAVLIVLIWVATGPMFHFSDSWQIVINTGTTIVTFLMVFLIQQSQNKDSVAIHIKLNELLASHEMASNRVVAIEDLDEAELRTLRQFYCHLAQLAAREGSVKSSHSLDEAEAVHQCKSRGHARRRRQAEEPG